MITASLTLALQATASIQRDLSKATDPLSVSIAQSLADGLGLNQANRMFSDTRTLASGANENIDVFDFVTGVDSIGQTMAQSRVVLVLIKNKNTTAGNKLVVGGEGSTAAWNSPFNGSDTAAMAIEPGGVLLLVAPSAAGYAVVDVANHLLKIANAGSGAVDYDIVIIGSQ